MNSFLVPGLSGGALFDSATYQAIPNRFKIKLVHGVSVVFASGTNKPTPITGKEYVEADGVWTRTPDLWVGVSWADCVPILFRRRDGQAVGAVHAGWRGTYDQIAVAFCSSLRAAGEDLREWQAWIGPSIRKCCYEVSADLISNFSTRFPKLVSSGDTKIDLALINSAQLVDAGISDVVVEAPCTCCTRDPSGFKFYSYRRDKTTVRQYAAIRIIK